MPDDLPKLRQRWIRSVAADYGMFFVLLLLMLVFSVLTYKRQRSTGAGAGREVADTILKKYGNSARVFIAAPGSAEDKAFVAAIQSRLADTDTVIAGSVTGAPSEARKAFEKVLEEKSGIDVVALTGAAATDWRFFRRFPQLTADHFVVAKSRNWPDFLKRTNLIGVANQTAIYAVIAIGMTMVIITGGIDLSVGSLVALSSVTATVLIRDRFGGEAASVTAMTAAFLVGIAVAAAAGFFNGVMVTAVSLPPFIVTLAMMLMASGVALRLSGFQSINAVPPSFQWLGGGSTFGIDNPILIMVVLYAVAHLVMSRSVFGRVLYAIGGNAEAARLSGIRVRRTKLIVYTITGALAGLGGIMLSSRLDAGDPKYGDMYELAVIAAVVVGGTSLMGGEGRMLGTLIGAFIIAVIRNGMNLMSVEPSNQKVALGAVLLVSVMIDQIKRRKS